MVKDRMAVLTALMDQGVIPVFYHPDVEVCKNVIQACADGARPASSSPTAAISPATFSTKSPSTSTKPIRA